MKNRVIMWYRTESGKYINLTSYDQLYVSSYDDGKLHKIYARSNGPEFYHNMLTVEDKFEEINTTFKFLDIMMRLLVKNGICTYEEVIKHRDY